MEMSSVVLSIFYVADKTVSKWQNLMMFTIHIANYLYFPPYFPFFLLHIFVFIFIYHFFTWKAKKKKIGTIAEHSIKFHFISKSQQTEDNFFFLFKIDNWWKKKALRKKIYVNFNLEIPYYFLCLFSSLSLFRVTCRMVFHFRYALKTHRQTKNFLFGFITTSDRERIILENKNLKFKLKALVHINKWRFNRLER